MPTKKEVLQDLQQKMLAADQTKEAPIIGRNTSATQKSTLVFTARNVKALLTSIPK